MGNSQEKNSFKRKKSFKEIFIKAVASHSAGNITEAIKEYNYLLNNGFWQCCSALIQNTTNMQVHTYTL